MEQLAKNGLPMRQILFHNFGTTARFTAQQMEQILRFWTFKNKTPNYCKWNIVTVSYSPYSKRVDITYQPCKIYKWGETMYSLRIV